MKLKLLLLSFVPGVLLADDFSWINFTTGAGKTIVKSIMFKNTGRFTFGDFGMTYIDPVDEIDIPYEGCKYIYFSTTDPSGIENVKRDELVFLEYSPSTQQISIRGIENASYIRIFNMQGALLRSVENSGTISTDGLPQGVIIANAKYKQESINKMFIIR